MMDRVATAPIEVPVFLDRMTDAIDYAVIGPTDGRRRVLNTRAFPFAAVCHVERDFGDGTWSGCSGFLVGPRTVVTAGHCISSPVRRRLKLSHVPRQIRVWAGRDGANAPFGFTNGAQWFVHSSYARSADPQHDLGLILLAQAVRYGGPYFELVSPPSRELARIRQRRLLHISGYPGDKPRGTQWTHEERLDSFDARRLLYTVDTCPGHSGSPVWVEAWNGRPASAIGVHVAGPTPHARGPWGCRPGVPMAPAGHFNRGVRMLTRFAGAIRRIGRTGSPAAPFVRLGRAS